MVPRGRVELPTPAFSGPRSTGELPRHGYNQRFYGKGAALKRENGSPAICLGVAEQFSPQGYFIESSNSRIQSFVFSTSLGFDPSAGPTIPSFSIRSIKRAARP